MLELGFNQTTYGTVLALGLIFSPFTKKTLLLPAISLVSLLIFAGRDGPVLRTSRGRASELEAKYLLVRLFVPGSIAVWSGNEAVLPAYIIGMVLAGCAGKINSDPKASQFATGIMPWSVPTTRLRLLVEDQSQDLCTRCSHQTTGLSPESVMQQ